MMLARKQKTRKVMCATFPHRALTISHTVWALGATVLREMARTPNKRTWIVAPDAYLRIIVVINDEEIIVNRFGVEC